MLRVAHFGMILGLAVMVGCEPFQSDDSFDPPVRPEPQGDNEAAGGDDTGDAGAGTGSDTAADSGSGSGDTGNNGGGTPSAPGDVPADFAGVQWLHTNVSGWPQTARLNASVSGGTVNLNYDKKNAWPTVNAHGTDVNANAWIFVYQDGRWYAATWEWLRPGQTTKSAASVNGSHIGRSPLNNFVPVSGERYGMMVSGLARDSHRNVQERSNVSMVVWP